MRKLIALFLSLAMALSLAACGSAAPETTEPSTQAPTEAPAETTAPEAAGPADAAELLKAIWALYGEEEKFAIFGGNVEAGVMGDPAAYDMAYSENMTYNLLIPQEQIANITGAASMIHAMNANTFTGAAFQLAEGVAAADFAAAMEAAVMGNMWMCGFPERLIITAVGEELVVAAFGVGDLMEVFAGHLAGAFPNAQNLYDQPIV